MKFQVDGIPGENSNNNEIRIQERQAAMNSRHLTKKRTLPSYKPFNKQELSGVSDAQCWSAHGEVTSSIHHPAVQP